MNQNRYVNRNNNRVYEKICEIGKGAFGKIDLCLLANVTYDRLLSTYTDDEKIKKKFFALKKIQNEKPERGLDYSLHLKNILCLYRFKSIS